MKRRYPIAALGLALAIAAPARGADAPLGRLFLTPERRALLEQQRQYNLQEQKTLEGASLRLDGVIVRSSGKKTLWINGQPQHDNRSDFGVEARVNRDNPGSAGLATGSEQAIDLRVGQQINRATREIEDGLGSGRLEVKPAQLKR